MRPLLEPATLWLRPDALLSELKNWPRMQLSAETLPEKAANSNLGYQPLPELTVQAQAKAPLDLLRQFLEQFTGQVIFSRKRRSPREPAGAAVPHQTAPAADRSLRAG